MTQLETTQLGTLEEPVPIPSLPFAQTIDLSERGARPGEPSPCLPSATSIWYSIRPAIAGKLMVDLAGSTPLDPVVRVYRSAPHSRGEPTFLGCASPAWNAQLALDVPVVETDIILVQVGTSESRDGRLVVRVEHRADGR
jgi:hypothetical protein